MVARQHRRHARIDLRPDLQRGDADGSDHRAGGLAAADPANVLPPITAYSLMRVGRLALVPYFRPGDPAVAEAIRALAGRHACVLLANHGPVVAGRSLESAVYAIEELEETARLVLLLRGLNPRLLSPDEIDELVRTFGLDPSIVAARREGA